MMAAMVGQLKWLVWKSNSNRCRSASVPSGSEYPTLVNCFVRDAASAARHVAKLGVAFVFCFCGSFAFSADRASVVFGICESFRAVSVFTPWSVQKACVSSASCLDTPPRKSALLGITVPKLLRKVALFGISVPRLSLTSAIKGPEKGACSRCCAPPPLSGWREKCRDRASSVARTCCARAASSPPGCCRSLAASPASAYERSVASSGAAGASIAMCAMPWHAG